MRKLVAGSLGLAFGMFGFALAAGFTGPSTGAIVAGVVVTALAGWARWARPIVPLDSTAASRALKVVALLATVAAFVQLARLTVFMVDPARPEYSTLPTSKWEVHHSCLSAYFVAAGAADHLPNIYADSLYSLANDDPAAVRRPRTLGAFNIDVYEYPPPFLLVPRALRLMTQDFTRYRAMWFGLNSAVILLVMLVLARSLGGVASTRALLLTPLVWVVLPTLSMLQKGNVQGLMIVLALLAMVCFEKRRWVAGGALLAYATVSKLFPGLLIIYLLLRRQWRAAAWTAAWSVVLAALTLIYTGWPAVTAFLAHLPGLIGGEAFPAFRDPNAMAINLSIPGLVFKLKLFGVPGMGFPAAKLVGWVYTLIVLAVIFAVAKRDVAENRRPLVWLAILVLATMRSPFLPQSYAAFPPLVLLVLLGALPAPPLKHLGAVLAAWFALSFFWPMDRGLDPRLLAGITFVPQVAMMVIALIALRTQVFRPVDA